MKNIRQVAVEAINEVENGGYSQLVFLSICKKDELSSEDRKFLSALFYGTLERKLTLDYCISYYAKRKIDKTIRQILEISFYQLMYMESVPDHAAVNEAVNLTRKMKLSSASGFINGVLRSFIRDKKVLPEIKGEISKKLSIEYSCELEIVKNIVNWYGIDRTREILESSFGTPPLYVRINTLKSNKEIKARIEKEKIILKETGLENCFIAESDIIRSDLIKEGFVHIQDICSQEAAMAIEAKENDKVLDTCAAPGSKSFVLAQEMKNKGKVLACDIYENRLNKIVEGQKRLGISCIETKLRDATIFDNKIGKFNKILCDVPCSGLGVIRRKPEIKYKNMEDFKELYDIQYKILETSSKLLEDGGRLVYSTCSINPMENQDQIEKFLKNNKDFELEENYRQILPSKDGGDGFFICKIRKKNGIN